MFWCLLKLVNYPIRLYINVKIESFVYLECFCCLDVYTHSLALKIPINNKIDVKNEIVDVVE
ncbi:MAG: hypothetical protein LBL77_01440 [Endomicrobium sp.]|jgi:hypothetical protein|nr:hypothetical protein [Endomicrobium sp.]